MLTERMRRMLDVASGLTDADLEAVRGLAPAGGTVIPTGDAGEAAVPVAPVGNDEVVVGVGDAPEAAASPSRRGVARTSGSPPSGSAAQRGEYERQRTRDSKVATACLGREREKHVWWPVGTQLVGQTGAQPFTALVVENPQVKSGRSLLLTSGPASGKVCLTPTRAAIEATEDHRKANQLGRAGGITNGWEFWKPSRT